ncbi:hypothetical protein D9758_000336 [Tetrapyrgos nigripes]|uniref:Uncharacterized protein n=1 Tax=Tetrapyrgos nigripes TaxID=182062 RepID=A0A8H5LZ22_9AGAR|nr:hypothetical protein D9758_000336 [Tetrapyrgos nigripes]
MMSVPRDFVVPFEGMEGILIDHNLCQCTSHSTSCILHNLARFFYENIQPDWEASNSSRKPPWPSSSRSTQSLVGPAHGLDMSEGEGIGIGRCVVVLAGGLSGGHKAEVLGAMFIVPQMDRAVKIWHFPPFPDDRLAREDKPLFSSTLIHKARVISVSWLNDDTLLTHSAPAVLSDDCGDDEQTPLRLEPGTVVLWRWTGLERFFPAHWDRRQRNFLGCASDYQESSSFKILSSYFLPPQETQYEAVSLSVTLDTGDPLILCTLPRSSVMKIVNITHWEPRREPQEPARNLQSFILSSRARLLDDPNDSQGWKVEIDHRYTELPDKEPEFIESCMMCLGGSMIIAGGSRGSLWVWTV